MKALRELAGLKRSNSTAKNDSPAQALDSDWDGLFDTASKSSKGKRRSRPPASLPLGKRESDIVKEGDAEKELARTSMHDPVEECVGKRPTRSNSLLHSRFNTVFPLDRHELSSVSERSELSTQARSPRSATDSFSSRAHSAYDLFATVPISSNTSADAADPGPPPMSRLPPLPSSPRQRATSASILAKIAPFSQEESTSDIPSRMGRAKIVESEADKVRKAEAIFQDRIKKDEEHRWRKAWLEKKNQALRKLKFDPAGSAKELGELFLQSGTERGEIDEQALDTAAAWFEKSLDADAGQAEVYYLLGRAYDRPGADIIRLERAQYAYRTAVTIDDSQPRYWVPLGVFEATRKHYDQAKTAFDRAIKAADGKGADAAIAWSNLGQLYEYHFDVVGDGQPESQRFEQALQAYLTAFELARGTDFAMTAIQRYDRLQQIRSRHFEKEEAEAAKEAVKDAPTVLSEPIASSGSTSLWRRSEVSAGGRQSLGNEGMTPEPIVPDTSRVTSAASSSNASPRHSPPRTSHTSPPLVSAALDSAFSNPTPSGMSRRESRRSRRSSSGSSYRARQAAGLQRIVDVLDRQTTDARERNDRLVEVLSQIRDRLPLSTSAANNAAAPLSTDGTLIEALKMLGDGSSRLATVIHQHEGAPAGLRALNALLTTSTVAPAHMAPKRPESR